MDSCDKLAQLATEFSGRMGLAAQCIDGEQRVLLNAEEIFPTASCIKIPILVELLFQARNGLLSLDDTVHLREDDQVPGTGVLKDLTPGMTLSLKDLATLAITVSDNSAANMLIDRVGQENINQRMSELGFSDIVLGTSFVFENPEHNVGSPGSFLQLLLSLARGTLMPLEDCDLILGIMRQQQYMDYIPRYLDHNRFAAEFGLNTQVEIANKVGMIAGVTNDIAVITLPEREYALVIFTKNCKDQRFSPDSEGSLLVAEASKLVFEHFNL